MAPPLFCRATMIYKAKVENNYYIILKETVFSYALNMPLALVWLKCLYNRIHMKNRIWGINQRNRSLFKFYKD